MLQHISTRLTNMELALGGEHLCQSTVTVGRCSISGTASINNKEEVVHPGNSITCKPTRMWENVEVLLTEAECTFEDLGQMIVYLRDIADYTVVKEMYDKRFPTP